MKIPEKYNGTIIGLFFFILSILSIFTVFIPIFTMFFGAMVESIVSIFVDKDPYSNVGRLTLVTFIVLFTISLLAINVYISKIKSPKKVKDMAVIIIMIINFCIVHCLGFYIYWGLFLNYVGDGQLIMAVYFTFPFSSLGFIIIGILIDLSKKRAIPHQEILPIAN